LYKVFKEKCWEQPANIFSFLQLLPKNPNDTYGMSYMNFGFWSSTCCWSHYFCQNLFLLFFCACILLQFHPHNYFKLYLHQYN